MSIFIQTTNSDSNSGMSRPAYGQDENLTDRIPLDGLDVDGAMRRLGNNLARYHKLLGMFKKGQAGTVARIGQELAQQNVEAALILAHTLKGVSATLGAMQLSVSAAQLESAIKTGQLDRAEGLLPALDLALTALLRQIEQVLPANDASEIPAASVLDVAGLLLHMSKLAELLDNYDSAASKEVESIAQLLTGQELAREFAEVAELVSQFEFDTAFILLNQIQQKVQS